MKLPEINLDDRTYDQLVSEGIALVSKQFPAWKDLSPSDPGITIIELFAYLFECVFYQINFVPDRTFESFARLLGTPPTLGTPINTTLKSAAQQLKLKYRAITLEDFERLAMEFATNANPTQLIGRVKAVLENITENGKTTEGVVKMVVVPNSTGIKEEALTQLLDGLYHALKERSLITTKIRVEKPTYQKINISAKVVPILQKYANKDLLKKEIENSIRKFLDPLVGGIDGNGWEFGRPLYRSDLYYIIEGIDEVDYIQQLAFSGQGDTTADINEIRLPTGTYFFDINELKITLSQGTVL